jgi:hypothetical protein
MDHRLRFEQSRTGDTSSIDSEYELDAGYQEYNEALISLHRISSRKDSVIRRLRNAIKHKRCSKLLNNIPSDVVVHRLVPCLDNTDMLRLCKISKLWHNQVLAKSNPSAWKLTARRVYEHYQTDQSMDFASLLPSQYKCFVELYTYSGCQLCDAPRIRKVYSMYKVRCCEACVRTHTISEYQLKLQYGIHASSLQSLSYRNVKSWNKHFGDTEFKCYWIADVEKLVLRTQGSSLEQLRLAHQLEQTNAHASKQRGKRKPSASNTLTLPDDKRDGVVCAKKQRKATTNDQPQAPLVNTEMTIVSVQPSSTPMQIDRNDTKTFYYCTYCSPTKSARRFNRQGLTQHTEAKHCGKLPAFSTSTDVTSNNQLL